MTLTRNYEIFSVAQPHSALLLLANNRSPDKTTKLEVSKVLARSSRVYNKEAFFEFYGFYISDSEAANVAHNTSEIPVMRTSRATRRRGEEVGKTEGERRARENIRTGRSGSNKK